MSERTAPALAQLDALTPLLAALPQTDDVKRMLAEVDALHRAVRAFHMEAIRFRMYNVERRLAAGGPTYPDAVRRTFEDLRHALETAGFHTRSHA